MVGSQIAGDDNCLEQIGQGYCYQISNCSSIDNAKIFKNRAQFTQQNTIQYVPSASSGSKNNKEEDSISYISNNRELI